MNDASESPKGYRRPKSVIGHGELHPATFAPEGDDALTAGPISRRSVRLNVRQIFP